ncbi:MAG: hypothetical protein WB760_09985 [Xanthobacteraceae bacterium]
MATMIADLRRMAARLAGISAFALALVMGLTWSAVLLAGESNYTPAETPLVRVDWQDPASLPPHFRNHCSFDVVRGRWFCSNHCGIDYQFYFCSPASFGCCHTGYGFCDWNGSLRCAP